MSDRWDLPRLSGLLEEEREAAAFEPQTSYGERGHLICTAVAYALAFGFLARPLQPVDVCLSASRIDRCMRACHAFFDENDIDRPLMLREMQRWFPMAPYGIDEGEVAGLTTLATDADGVTEDGDLLLQPLRVLLEQIRTRERDIRFALVVTYGEHTRLIFSRAPGDLCVFDPLHGPVQRFGVPTGVEYAGLLLAELGADAESDG